MSAITPRISDIPKGKSSSDYKVCNIVDFRGINCAENPLDIKLGEASDMKNLYVNDELSLTTRPRLGWVETLGDFSKILYDDGTILFGLDTSEDKKYKCWYRYKDGQEEKHKDCSFEDNSFDIDKWSIFKNSKGTYFLTCNKGYYYLDVSNVSNYTFKNVIYSEEAYIPTTKIGKSFSDPNIGTEYEQRNLLSKKYKETYLFNLEETVVPSSFKNEKIELKNEFEVTKSPDITGLDKISGNADDVISVISTSRKYKLDLEYHKSLSLYYIGITDYENQKCMRTLVNSNTDFYKFVTTKFEGTVGDLKLANTNLKVYPLIGKNSNDEYVIYIIKTAVDNTNSYTVNIGSLWIFTIDKNNTLITTVKKIAGSDYNTFTEGFFSGNVTETSNGPILKFFLKDDDSTIIYKTDMTSDKVSTRSINYIDCSKEDLNTFTGNYYSQLIRSSLGSTKNPKYTIIDYYNDMFFYKYTIESTSSKSYDYYIIQKGKLNFTIDYNTMNYQYTLTEGSFYGVYIPDYYGDLIQYEFIANGVLLIFDWKTVYLKINTSCPTNQILNNQDSSDIDIFNFKYDENLLEYENSLYNLANLSEGHIYFLRDNIKKVIYYDNGQYYLTSDITKRDAANNIKLTLDSSQSFLGKEAYFDNKKIVLITDPPKGSVDKHFTTITYDPSAYNLIDIERSYTDDVKYSHDFSKVSIFDDKYWFYRSESEPNLIRYSYDTTGLYIPENSYDDIGDSAKITSVMQIADNYLGIFKENSAFTVTEDEETSDLYYVRTLKTELGNVPVGQTIVTSYSNNPLVINDYGIYGLGQNKNILETDSVFYSVTDKITSKYIKIKNKQNIKTHNHRFYTYFYYSEDNITKIWVLDNRFNAWYYWELPIPSIDYIYDKVYDLTNADEVLTYIWSGNKLYTLTTSYYGVLGNGNDSNLGASDIIGYQDYLNSDKGAYKRIEWYWKTPPLILQTINYLKKIVDMSMLFADAERETMYDSKHHKLIYGPGTDYRNNLELFYDIKTYRKKSMLLNGSYKGRIDYVSNARVKPRCQKCDFAALTLYNKIVKDDDNITYTYDNSNSDNDGYNNGYDIIDKLNLIGLTFKVVLS